MTDIAKLLKNAQYGLELYSTIFGVVYLKGVNDNLTIAVYDKNKIARYFNKYGQYFDGFDDAECQLFPAKGQSWDEWKHIVELAKASFNVHRFKIGDWIISKDKNRIYQITDIRGKKYFYDNTAKYDYINIADDLYDLWTIQDAKPGDILVANGAPFIYKSHDNNYVFHYCGINLGAEFVVSEKDNSIWNSNTKITPANQIQCNSLFRKMEDFGYVWDPDKKVLSKKTKFKVGDWIISDHPDAIFKVGDLKKATYKLIDIYGDSHDCQIIEVDKNYHLWTVNDAKPGDILCYKDEISLFKTGQWECDSDKFIGFEYYCCYDGKILVTNGMYSLTEKDKSDVHLATEEQMETLLSHMASAGYIWDSNNKTLKKSKFKIWDWIINNKDKRASQITEIICDKKDSNILYGYAHTNGFFANKFEDNYHLWTIKDAKKGDILSAKIDGDDYILIFKQIKDGWIETYGHYYITIDKFCVPTQLFCRDYQGTLHPATQEQCKTLFKKMRDDGYNGILIKKF